MILLIFVNSLISSPLTWLIPSFFSQLTCMIVAKVVFFCFFFVMLSCKSMHIRCGHMCLLLWILIHPEECPDRLICQTICCFLLSICRNWVTFDQEFTLITKLHCGFLCVERVMTLQQWVKKCVGRVTAVTSCLKIFSCQWRKIRDIQL